MSSTPISPAQLRALLADAYIEGFTQGCGRYLSATSVHHAIQALAARYQLELPVEVPS